MTWLRPGITTRKQAAHFQRSLFRVIGLPLPTDCLPDSRLGVSKLSPTHLTPTYETPSSKTGSQLATRQRRGLFHHHATLVVLSASQLTPDFGRESSSKSLAHTLSGFAESLLPFRTVPPVRTSKSISHHLDNFLRSQRTPLAHYKHRRPGWLPDFGRENREKSLPYSIVLFSLQLPPIRRHCRPYAALLLSRLHRDSAQVQV